MKKNVHSNAFYKKKYVELKQFAKSKGIKAPWRSIREFKSEWAAHQADGVHDITSKMKYDMQYDTGYKTALAELKAAKSAGIKDVKLKDLQKMTTTDFAEAHRNELDAMYRSAKAKGMTGKEAGAYISNYWFGSN